MSTEGLEPRRFKLILFDLTPSPKSPEPVKVRFQVVTEQNLVAAIDEWNHYRGYGIRVIPTLEPVTPETSPRRPAPTWRDAPAAPPPVVVKPSVPLSVLKRKPRVDPLTDYDPAADDTQDVLCDHQYPPTEGVD